VSAADHSGNGQIGGWRRRRTMRAHVGAERSLDRRRAHCSLSSRKNHQARALELSLRAPRGRFPSAPIRAKHFAAASPAASTSHALPSPRLISCRAAPVAEEIRQRLYHSRHVRQVVERGPAVIHPALYTMLFLVAALPTTPSSPARRSSASPQARWRHRQRTPRVSLRAKARCSVGQQRLYRRATPVSVKRRLIPGGEPHHRNRGAAARIWPGSLTPARAHDQHTARAS